MLRETKLPLGSEATAAGHA